MPAPDRAAERHMAPIGTYTNQGPHPRSATVPSLGFMAIAVYSDKAREVKHGKTLSLRDKGAERYTGGRPDARA